MTDLSGRVVIITGAARNIGRTTAEHLARSGARVAIVDIDAEAAATAAREIGAEAIGLCADIADPGQVAAMVAAVHARFGRIDGLFNNVRVLTPEIIAGDTHAADIDLDVWDRIFEVNVRGTLIVSKSVIPHMLAAGAGSIVNMASMEGLAPRAGVRIGYATSKAAIVQMSRHIAASYGKQGLRCNAIAPGTTMTDSIRRNLTEAQRARALETIMTPYLGEQIDIAHLVAFLMSEDSRYITGQVISIDGGALAFRPD
ncbi:MAG: SDR family NAD(P)-dependent oxidoreductase [Gammaproteobacteria bacterium]